VQCFSPAQHAAFTEHISLSQLLDVHSAEACQPLHTRPSPTAALRRSRCFLQPPVLVLWGRQDRILPPATAQQFADALPDATVTYLENSGHSGHLEEPEAAAAAILDFVGGCATGEL
jgi:pimeloyl-ACP methyl ester carboxylesterase